MFADEVASTSGVSPSEAILAVSVPADAKVFVNGNPTKSTGELRQFVSRGLDSSSTYNYEVKATVNVDGKDVEEVKNVVVRPGQIMDVAFSFESATVVEEPISSETVLILNVPENAKVTLGGNPTKATGTTRVFRTAKLANGAAWSDYTVKVSYEKDGKEESMEKTITLRAGETQNVTFMEEPAQGKIALR
jgi:uncharacterized protein (TIGR03000 family)